MRSKSFARVSSMIACARATGNDFAGSERFDRLRQRLGAVEIGVFLVVLIVFVLIGRMNAEGRLSGETFGAEYEAYRARAWRLMPYVYRRVGCFGAAHPVNHRPLRRPRNLS